MLDLDAIYEPKLVSAEQFSDIQRRVYTELGVTPEAQAYMTTHNDELERAWKAWCEANLIKEEKR